MTSLLSTMNSNLSHRLQTIHNLTPLTKHIYDVGCDHGDLGLSFASILSVEEIVLVDPSDDVIQNLKLKLQNADIPKRTSLLKRKTNQIEIKNNSTVIMCGFGGEQIREGVEFLFNKMDQSSFFVLSPHRDLLKLRQALSQLPLTLEKELIVIENNQFYPVMVLKNQEGPRLHPYGEGELWGSPQGESYRRHLIEILKHHQNPSDQQFLKYLESI